MSEVGVKISMPNNNVLYAPDNKLIFNSKYSSLKIHSQGSGSHLYTSGGGTIELTNHGLGYRPFFIGQVNSPPNDNFKITSFTDIYDTFWYVQYVITATDTVLRLVNINSWVGGALEPPPVLPDRQISYRWMIFYDPIKDE